MRRGLLSLWLCVVAPGCDALVEHPRIGVPKVRITSPVDGSHLVEPGSTFPVEVELEGCQRPASVEVSAGGAPGRATPLQSLEEPGRYGAEVPVADVLEAAAASGAEGPLRVQLSARLRCDDFGQQTTSEAISLSVSLVAFEQVLPTAVRALEPGGAPGTVLASSDDALVLLGPGAERAAYGRPAAGGKVRQVGDRLYFWSPCADPLCLTRASVLAVLKADSLVAFPEPPLQLEGDLIDALPGLAPDELLLAVGTPRPQLRFSKPDLSAPVVVPLGLAPVSRAGHRGDEIVFLGVGMLGVGELKVVAVGPGRVVVERATGFVSTSDDSLRALTDLSPAAERAVMLVKGTADLHRFSMADGHLESCALPGAAVWHSVKLLSEDEVLVVDSGSVRVVRWSDCTERWRLEPAAGVRAAAPLGDGRFAVLTSELELLRVDASGTIESRRPAVPGPPLTSNLVIGSDGIAYYALENRVIGRRP